MSDESFESNTPPSSFDDGRPHRLAKAPAKRKKRKATKKAVIARPARDAGGELAGITGKACPSACTAERCVISTVAVCKHPFKSSMNGCGPITLANRERARKLIKHQKIDARG